MTEQELTAHQPVLRTIPSVNGNGARDGDGNGAAEITASAAGGIERVSRMFVAEEHLGGLGTFAPTDVERAKQRRQEIARVIFLLMALSLVIPVLMVLGDLVIKAWPVLSWSFLTTNPVNRMTGGGIW